jgi:hypothetical protein
MQTFFCASPIGCSSAPSHNACTVCLGLMVVGVVLYASTQGTGAQCRSGNENAPGSKLGLAMGGYVRRSMAWPAAKVPGSWRVEGRCSDVPQAGAGDLGLSARMRPAPAALPPARSLVFSQALRSVACAAGQEPALPVASWRARWPRSRGETCAAAAAAGRVHRASGLPSWWNCPCTGSPEDKRSARPPCAPPGCPSPAGPVARVARKS